LRIFFKIFSYLTINILRTQTNYLNYAPESGHVNFSDKPGSGPLIESSNKVFENNTIFLAIGTRQQTLDCSVTGGYPSPSISWACFTGTAQDLSSRLTITKRWTWAASGNVHQHKWVLPVRLF
jgi:hypothetical protein